MGTSPLRRDDHDAGDPPTVAAAKAAARRRALALRSDVPPAERARAAVVVQAHLEDLRAAASAVRIGLYAARGEEIGLDDVAARWLAAGLEVAFPRVAGSSDMVLRRVVSLADLAPGAFGIREPSPGAPALGDVDLLVVPGLAFDRLGGRLGHGRGYYDRHLSELGQAGRSPLTVGVCLSAQLLDAVPQGPHDVRLDAVVTEGGVYR